jgi:hypothetical protein
MNGKRKNRGWKNELPDEVDDWFTVVTVDGTANCVMANRVFIIAKPVRTTRTEPSRDMPFKGGFHVK